MSEPAQTSPNTAKTVPGTVVDGVERLPPSGISVLVVGGGIAGLAMACESWRQGHDVRVLERTTSIDQIGDTFGIIPPAWTTLRFYPTLLKEFHNFSHDAVFSIYRHEGRKLWNGGEADWNKPGVTHPAHGVRVPWILRRYDVVKELEAQARRLSISVEYGKNVVEYDEDDTKATVRTTTGEEYSADLVVAADGVSTKSHKHVTGAVERPSSSGYAVYRGMIPIERLANVSEDAKKRVIQGERPEFRIYIGANMHLNVVTTPDFVNYLLTHKDTGNADESWRGTGSAEDVLRVMKESPGWDPAVLEVVAQTPDDTVIDWKLLWRDPKPKWHSDGGRVIQLGDSAHSFLPTSGNGATQAMEDSLSLATCLTLGGRDALKDSVKAHALMRFERTSTLQRFGFATRQFLHTVDVDAAEEDDSKLQLKMSSWIWKHDPVQYARDNYQQAIESVTQGAPFENTNLPPGYKYVPWTIQDELEREEKGLMTELFNTGDWS